MAESEAFPSTVQDVDIQPLPGRALSLFSMGISPLLFPPSHIRQSMALRHSGYRAARPREYTGRGHLARAHLPCAFSQHRSEDKLLQQVGANPHCSKSLQNGATL